MNQKTAKLLNRYANEVGENYKEVRRRWEELNQNERAKMRRQMKVAIHREERSGESEEAAE